MQEQAERLADEIADRLARESRPISYIESARQ